MFILTAKFILLQKRDERVQSHGFQNKLFQCMYNVFENECLSATKRDGTQEMPEKQLGLFPCLETGLTTIKMIPGECLSIVFLEIVKTFFLSEEVMKISPTVLQAYSSAAFLFWVFR